MKVKLAWIFLALVALLFIGLYATGWFLAITAPLSIEYEGPCLWATLKLKNGQGIYDALSLTKSPWEVVIYPPVFFLVCVPFQVIAGTSYWGLRLVSILSLIVSSISSYRIFFRSCNSHFATATALVCYLSFMPVWSWSFKGRVDMLSMSLSIVAIDLFLVAYDRRMESNLDDDKFFKKFFRLSGIYGLFIICCVLAIFTKQPSVMIPMAVAIFLLTKKRSFDYLIISFGSGILSLLTLYSIDYWTAGGFMQHMKFLSRMPFSWNDLGLHISWMGSDWAKILLLPICMFFLRKRKPGSLDTTLPVTLILISGLLTFYSLGTMYANVNHALHFYWSCSWLIAICLALAPIEIAVVLLSSTLLSFYALSAIIPNIKSVVSKMPKTLRVLNEENLIGTSMFVEDPALALAIGAEPLFVDVATFIQVWEKERRDLSDIKKSILNNEYSAIVINRHDSQLEKPPYFWSQSLVRLIRKQYKYNGTVIGNGEVQDLFIRKSAAERAKETEEAKTPQSLED